MGSDNQPRVRESDSESPLNVTVQFYFQGNCLPELPKATSLSKTVSQNSTFLACLFLSQTFSSDKYFQVRYDLVVVSGFNL